MKKPHQKTKRPNILLIMADEYRFPRYFGTDYGMLEPIKHILGFQGDDESIAEYADYFPGLIRLRQNATVLRKHTIAASACVPSRAVMFTGQYGARTGVTQTDGVFKSGDANNYPWLKPDGIPTMGDWFRAAGYDTHYFGKCHFADPPDHSLQEFGFDDWEHSYPEPHGSSVNNLGIYRDFGFTDLVTTFLRGKGLALGYDRAMAEQEVADPDSGSVPPGRQRRKDRRAERRVRQEEQRPWFAVASFTNPHDITTYPMLPRKADPESDKLKPPRVPKGGSRSSAPDAGTWEVPLNPDGFPQENANLPPTWREQLYRNNKPDCQYDYSLKLGIALASKGGNLKTTMMAPKVVGLPLPLSNDPRNWSKRYLQYYTYLHYALDRHIAGVLDALDETGLRDETIVVFAPDHGDYGAAHGMLQQKWHSAYQEAIHVPVVISSPQVNRRPEKMNQVDELTSHIDLIPTLLGLAGVGPKERSGLASELRIEHDVPNLVGEDLSGIIEGKRKKTGRKGVLFVTGDMITQPLSYIDDPHNAENLDHYQVYCEAVEKTIDGWPKKKRTPPPKPGAVCQPCHVECVRQGDWKLVRYFDGGNPDVANQWELYDIEKDVDPFEETNLLVYDGDFPTAIPKKDFPEGLKLSREKVEEKARELRALMGDLTEKMLGPGDYPGEPPKCVGTDED